MLSGAVGMSVCHLIAAICLKAGEDDPSKTKTVSATAPFTKACKNEMANVGENVLDGQCDSGHVRLVPCILFPDLGRRPLGLLGGD